MILKSNIDNCLKSESLSLADMSNSRNCYLLHFMAITLKVTKFSSPDNKDVLFRLLFFDRHSPI